MVADTNVPYNMAFDQNLQAEPILIEKSIFPPGHPEASTFIGEVIWKIVRELDPVSSHD